MSAGTETVVEGAAVWLQLEVSSFDGIAEFYGAALGWALDGDGDERVFTSGGVVVAGASRRDAVDAGAGYWRTYLGAVDVDDAVGHAVAAGAVVTADDRTLPCGGVAVDLVDVESVPFGIARPDSPVASSTKPGRHVLTDATYHDQQRGVVFHTALGEGLELIPADPPIVVVRDVAGRDLRAVNAVPDELQQVMPAHWLPWFAVADEPTAIEAVRAVGGRVNTSGNPLSFGQWGVVADPSGAELKLLQPAIGW